MRPYRMCVPCITLNTGRNGDRNRRKVCLRSLYVFLVIAVLYALIKLFSIERVPTLTTKPNQFSGFPFSKGR